MAEMSKNDTTFKLQKHPNISTFERQKKYITHIPVPTLILAPYLHNVPKPNIWIYTAPKKKSRYYSRAAVHPNVTELYLLLEEPL